MYFSRVSLVFLLSSFSAFASETIHGGNSLSVTLNPNGSFSVGSSLSGTIGVVATNIGVTRAVDYQQIDFDYTLDAPRHGSIRVFINRPAVLFSVTYGADSANASPFPTFSAYPANLFRFSFAGMFGAPSFGGLAPDSPWAFYDSLGNTFIISPASDFMISASSLNANNSISSGISSKIAALPKGLTHRTLLVMESGINRAFETWGRVLTDLSGKVRPANDADLSLRTLGYWTDNGATYYYDTAPSLSYPDTLSSAKAQFDTAGLPIGYLQLDSWFYPKGVTSDWRDHDGGIFIYEASTDLFPNGLRSFQRELGVPLLTHARWIDSTSPYRQQFQVSGNVATDARYWDAAGKYLQANGVATYEQDWLGDNAHSNFNFSDPEAFMNNMAAGMAASGITMQYCMAEPKHFLAGSKFSNLTSIRTSDDRFNRNRWTNFLFGSRLAFSVGSWPFTDVFMSKEADNLLLATLSAGPVGVGDALGEIYAANLLQSVRADGVIVKPDVPLLPMDASYIAKATRTDKPVVASTYSDFGALRQSYVFSYSEGQNLVTNFALADLGVTGPAYVYSYFLGAGKLHGAADSITEILTSGRAYYVVAPVGPSGMAILGDLDQFVPLGKKRVSELTDPGWAVYMTVNFAAGEQSRVIQGYAPSKPAVLSLTGTAALTYDAGTQIFRVTVQPGEDLAAKLQIAILN